MHPQIRGTIIVLASVAIATVLTFPLARIAIHSRDLFFIAAIVVTARFAGVAAGLYAALLCFLVFDWFFDRTPGALDLTAAGVLRAFVFGAVSLLVAAIERQRRHAISRLETANQDLRNALDQVKTLHGILPICSHCKQIRTNAGTWVQLEKYIHDHSQAEFTHSICPGCLQKYYPEVAQRTRAPE